MSEHDTDTGGDKAEDTESKDNAEVIRISMIDDKDRHDIRLQQIIDDLARRSDGRAHEDVTAELTEQIAAADLPPMPQPWIDAVGAAAISGNAYVVSSTSAALSDVPPPETKRPEKDVT